MLIRPAEKQHERHSLKTKVKGENLFGRQTERAGETRTGAMSNARHADMLQLQTVKRRLTEERRGGTMQDKNSML